MPTWKLISCYFVSMWEFSHKSHLSAGTRKFHRKCMETADNRNNRLSRWISEFKAAWVQGVDWPSEVGERSPSEHRTKEQSRTQRSRQRLVCRLKRSLQTLQPRAQTWGRWRAASESGRILGAREIGKVGKLGWSDATNSFHEGEF